jgi:hypothetical protein
VGKYNPLESHLRRDGRALIKLRLGVIGAIVELPDSARNYSEWWNNEDVRTTRHVQCKAWQAAGYEAQPDLGSDTVTFRRKRGAA